MMKPIIIIAGGGTGGHIYPALALGQEIKHLFPQAKIIYIGSRRPLEKKLMEEQGVEFYGLQVEGLKGKGLQAGINLLKLPLAMEQTSRLLRRFKPSLVIGMGGFSSGPVVLVASLKRIPTVILEQNVRLGFTNRLLLRWVKKVVVSFAGTLSACRGKGELIGNPVRPEFYRVPEKRKLSPDILTVFIFGGSQGSHFLNSIVTQALPQLKNLEERLSIIHQTGEKEYEMIKATYEKLGFNQAIIKPFFDNMADIFARTDLVICRAGATTIAELIAAQQPALLVPFAQATENHQYLNAQELVQKQAALLATEDEFTPEFLVEKINYFLDHRDELHQISRNLAFFRREDVTAKIARLCLSLINHQREKV
jgi:UDP-N-acetylglucosamine--N-acetylmuramyl-(pentapeptide) pyrophosphoryl-undecaprenol N-acetylglucosamine transferase